MLYTKAIKRIDISINELNRRKLTEIDSSFKWVTADKKEALNENFNLDDVSFKEVEAFPHFWAHPWINTLFKSQIKYKKEANTEYYLNLSTETDTFVYIDSKPQGAINPFHPLFDITPFSDNFDILLEAWGGHLFPGYHPSEGGRVLTAVAMRKKNYPLTFSKPVLLKKNPNTWSLYFDCVVLRGLLATLDEKSLLYQSVLSNMHKALITLDFSSSDECLDEMAKKAKEMLRPTLESHNGTICPTILSIGNAHLDHAWLWPINETERKAARTLSQMMKYLEKYPEFKFTFTQPVQMKAVKDRYPSIFEKLKEAEKGGRFEVQGISWVEPDCMLPSGESFVRQFIFGRKLIRELLGSVKGSVFWVPDSFGYNAQLPQILKKSGIDYFVTSKIGWNDTNAFPYDLFMWEGLDGTKIPSHMIVDAYEGKNEPEQIMHVYNKIRHKDIQDTLLRSIGEGDGGGGTMLEDIENLERMHDLQGLPKNSWVTLQSAMERIFASTDNLPTYKGELYLELHRGTYTVQAEVKKCNRMLERALEEVDILISEAFVKEGLSERVKSSLNLITDAWKILLTNQFHDILPGSCIKEAMDEAVESYKNALQMVSKVKEKLNASSLSSDFHFAYKKEKLAGKVFIKDGAIIAPWGKLIPDGMGGFSSVVVNSRELVKSGKSFNTITFSPDETVNWDAWDMESDMIPLRKRISGINSVSIEEAGDDVLITVNAELSNTSKLEQRIIVRASDAKIDFYTVVDWNEKHKILRAEFDSVINSPYANFAVPFGYISRSTGDSTTVERAQFEVPAGRFVHLGDTQNSLIMTSDSKYGYRVKNGEASISLLRSPKAPDPSADIGHHEFSYSCYFANGGAEGLRSAIRAGYDWEGQYMPSLPFSWRCERGSVILDSVKVSEDRDGIILRFYEAEGSQGLITICYDNRVKEVYDSDLIEEHFTKFEGQEISFSPFMIKTLKLTLNL